MPTLTYNQWIAIGIDNGWCGPAICYVHDGLPMTRDEQEDLIDGEEPCVHIISCLLYTSPSPRD